MNNFISMVVILFGIKKIADMNFLCNDHFKFFGTFRKLDPNAALRIKRRAALLKARRRSTFSSALF